MSRTFFTANLPAVTTPGPNETLIQIVPAADLRVALKSIELMPLGATGASQPITFHLVIQDGAGTSSDGTSNLVKNSPAAGHTLQTTARTAFTVEPSTNTLQYAFSLHQQGSRIWVPPNAYGEIIMEVGTRWGLRVVDTLTYNIAVAMQLEE